MMTNHKTNLESLYEKAENYGKTSIELYKLRAIDKTADIASSLISRLAVFIALVLSGLMINIGLALWIGHLLKHWSYGFFTLGGFYILLAAFLHIFRNVLIKIPISHSIITHFLKQNKI
jgi:hypothetical protein